MKYFIGSEIESDIYDKFRVQRNRVLDVLIPLQEITTPSLNEISFSVYILKKIKVAPMAKYILRYKRLELEIQIDHDLFLKNTDDANFELIKKSIIEVTSIYKNKKIEDGSLEIVFSKIKDLLK